jgi:hypothetical protein
VRISFFISTFGGSPLQVGLERGFSQLGHSVSYFTNGTPHNFDFLVAFNQIAHNPAYAYPDFPSYNVPIVFIDAAEYGYFTRLPEVADLYANAFSQFSMKHENKSVHEQTRLKRYLEGKAFPYFLREMSKYVQYPTGYYPIDYPLYEPSRCSDRPERGDYLRRVDPLFVSWGASHPWRWPITNALRAAQPNAEILVLGENGTPRMLQSTYFNRMTRARCSVSFDGYGSSSFRMTEVLMRTVLLMGPLAIVTRAPLVDGETCVAYNLYTCGEEVLSTNVADKLAEVLADPERSFKIHERGYSHCEDYLSEVATAKYVLDVVDKHDWSKPTELNVP